jgi:ankyrin repeat protein
MKRYLVLVLLAGIQSSLIHASWVDTVKGWFGYSSEQQALQRKQNLEQELQKFSDQEKKIIKNSTLNDLSDSDKEVAKIFFNYIKNDQFDRFLRNVALMQNKDKVMYLFQYGIPATNFPRGTTPLHVAAYFQKPLFLEYFLSLLGSAPLSENKLAWINVEINGMTALDFVERSTYSMSQRNEKNNKICMNLLESNGALHGYLYRQALQQQGTAVHLNFIDMELN